MSLPYGLSIERLTQIFLDLHNYIKNTFEDFDEKEFIKSFFIDGEFIFNFRRFYNLDEAIFAAYLKNGIEMEYNDIIKDSDGNELSFEQCQKLVRWYIGDQEVNEPIGLWISMIDNFPNLDLNTSIYNLFKCHIRTNIFPDLNVKAKFEKKEEIYTDSKGLTVKNLIYYTFIGLQAGRGIPFGFSEYKLKEQFRHKYQDFVEEYDRETEMYKKFQDKITKSTIICRKFLNKVSKKYKKPKILLTLCGKLVDEIILYGLKITTDQALKLSEQICNEVKNTVENV